MSYIIEGDNVYYEDERIKEHVGMVNKTETIPIDADTVADVIYQFDLTAGDYVEQSRLTRPVDLSVLKQHKLNELESKYETALQTFQSSALGGSPNTYLIGQDDKGRDYMTLFNGEFSYVTSPYYDPSKTILWYTLESGNVVHTKDQFIQVFLDAKAQVESVKYKRADYEKQINDPAITTSDQINAITITF